MPTSPTSADEFLKVVQKSGLVEPETLRKHVMGLRELPVPPRSMQEFAQSLVEAGLTTDFHMKNMLRGRYKGFVVGKYKVMQPIGSGGMGTVYLCRHMTMGHKVAMKILPAKATNNQVSVERFFREARAAAGLNHPNIVRAHDIDNQDNFYYLVMDYVQGVSLQDLAAKGPLNSTRAAHYVAQACHGLQYIHNSGLAHRDIKPGNLLVDREGTLKILDLGLAVYLDDRADKLTQQLDGNGSILGTADYISPEQTVESHSVDNRTDIYSLGATFYYILTGRPPFDGASTVQKLMYHQTHEPVKIEKLVPEVPSELAEIVRKMMAKNPEDRYQQPADIATALEPYIQSAIDAPSEEEIPSIAGLNQPNTAQYSTGGSPQSGYSLGRSSTARAIGASSGLNAANSDLRLSPERPSRTRLYAAIGGLTIAACVATLFLVLPIGQKSNQLRGSQGDTGEIAKPKSGENSKKDG